MNFTDIVTLSSKQKPSVDRPEEERLHSGVEVALTTIFEYLVRRVSRLPCPAAFFCRHPLLDSVQAPVECSYKARASVHTYWLDEAASTRVARLRSMQRRAGTVVPPRLPASRWRAWSIAILAALPFVGLLVQAQEAGSVSSPALALQSHYEAAQAFREKGDLQQASLQFQLFISNALDHLAMTRASIGDYGRSSVFFDEALLLSPNNHYLQLDSAEEALASGDMARGRLLAEKAVSAEPEDARAHRILGRALLRTGESERGTKELERAVAIEPDFTNGYALACGYLALGNKERAAAIFHEMEASLGDKAAIHMQFGTAYGEAGFAEEAIHEFQKTIKENPKCPDAHYSLGASYLLIVGEVDYAQAEVEFQKELEINPNDFLSHEQLGYVALSQHRIQDAERELTRAQALNPRTPDVFMWLGQLYVETRRNAEAEVALRKSIALTANVAHNHYQVQRAHYLLARLLLQTDRAEDGKREMQISQDLLTLSAPGNRGTAQAMPGGAAGEDLQWRDDKNFDQLDPQALIAAEADEKQLGPAIADSYNDMGVIAAASNNYESASDLFEKASKWNPTLDGLDYNWGKAAYSGHLYGKAVGPLSRYVESHPEDIAMRSTLGISLFLVHDYTPAVTVLEPIASRADAAPSIAFVYAQSLVETGEYDRGIAKLKAIIANDPQKASYHRALGEAFAHKKDYREAAEEFRNALQSDSSDVESKYYLALALVQLQQTKDALVLLTEMAKSGSKIPDVYFQLGKLELEGADAKSAIVSLQEAVGLSPGSELIHEELAAAYLRDSRPEDADRETRQAKAIHNSHGATIESPHKD